MSYFNINQSEWCVKNISCNTFYVRFNTFCTFTTLDHLKRSHTKARNWPWPRICFETIWPICTYQYLISFGRKLWHVAFLISRIFSWKIKLCTIGTAYTCIINHFPKKNDLNSFTTESITKLNKYHLMKAMQDTVCVHFTALYIKQFAQCWMKTSRDGF